MRRQALPRIVVAGLAGDAGKTLLAVGLARVLARAGRRVAAFKNGPDFIDAAWLGAAAGAPGRNLDTYLMPASALFAAMRRAAAPADLVLVEGKRGLFDGVDARGTHSTAQLAKLVGAPVVLVLNAAKATRTLAAPVLGCKALDPELPLAGVVLNRVGTSRQEALVRRALADDAGVPVLGAIPRLAGGPLPSRHLGLVCAAEHPERDAAIEALADAIRRHVDVERIVEAAEGAPELPHGAPAEPPRAAGARVRIAVLRDAAFSFYYPENLEALEAAGAELVFVSPLADRELPPVDALYAGGGFPEEHAAALAANEPLRAALGAALARGLPAWAECGGLMYLARALVRDGREYPMVGALPIVVEHTGRPQGHGYMAATVDGWNPFFPVGTRLLGHEFHHSRVAWCAGADTTLAVERGTGLGGGRDGLVVGGVVATYMHLHALSTPGWAESVVRAGRRFARRGRSRREALEGAVAPAGALAAAGGSR
ncbi:MAG TPA: cobyrinate a,c-diamide synthase [Anaeromyxobacter sp.]|nr:cobyrinate a,c-diamide synthase [Anaeromyxobacter sp.]